MTERRFFDTNVLVYAHDSTDPRRQEIAAALLEDCLRAGTAVLSLQVLQEFYVVATRKLRPPLHPNEARSLVGDFLHHPLVETTGSHVLRAIDLSVASQVSLWDALIFVAAASAGCSVLYSEDLAHGSTIAGVKIENPFRP